jgi:maltose alpha-D-glucosyltransferase/alpha-amylase
MHRVLALGTDPAFAPEPSGKLYQRSLYQSMRTLTGRLCRRLSQGRDAVPEPALPLVDWLISREERILDRFHGILDPALAGKRIRCHGDFHLAQLLFTGKDFVIVDFEGDSSRPIGERRIKRSPLRDLASMLRSLDYAVFSVLQGVSDVRGRPPGKIRPEDRPALDAWAHFWYEAMSRTLVASYLEAISAVGLLPRTSDGIHRLLALFLLEKALFEIDAELSHRPEWIEIPLRGAVRLLGGDSLTQTPQS